MAGGIFCIENWSGDLRSTETVAPLLDFLARHGSARVIHQRVSTPFELCHYMSRFADLRSYQVAYLALHGERGRVFVGNRPLDLEQLVIWSRGDTEEGLPNGSGDIPVDEECVVDLSGKVLYLGSCASLGVDRARLRRLRAETGAAAICGFTEALDWYEVAAIEIMLLATLAEAVDASDGEGGAAGVEAGIRRLRERVGPLLDGTLGFVCEPDWGGVAHLPQVNASVEYRVGNLHNA
jgi:hypothetical protein